LTSAPLRLGRGTSGFSRGVVRGYAGGGPPPKKGLLHPSRR